ncbi:hypothetical protein HOLleu_29314 [Holothuria leucospilota]|uniref:Uncharacterized protein n=1 Tax=Holothuria leucospilota TaxID=206669 RepID=A0A9Q1H1L6_HOLLE|nr:hypothetical protein HOLleu_29314 [Holothuria leucospilota]
MTEDCFMKLYHPSKLQDINWLRLTAANGGVIPYLGYFKSDIEVVPQRGILVIRVQKEVPILLGMDTIKELHEEVIVRQLGLAKGNQPTNPNKVIQGLVRVAGRSKIQVPAIGKLSIQVVNLTKDNVWLNPRTPLGKLQMVDTVEDGSVIFGETVSSNQISCEEPWTTALLQTPNLFGSDLTDEQLKQKKQFIAENAYVFASSDADLGFTNTVEHTVPTLDDVSVKQTYRRIPPSQFEDVKEHVRKLLEKKIIRPSTCPYASTIVLEHKSDGTLRLCVDYCKLNQKTRKDAHPLPRL